MARESWRLRSDRVVVSVAALGALALAARARERSRRRQRDEAETAPAAPHHADAPDTAPAAPVDRPVPVVVASAPTHVGMIRGLASDYKAVASIVGLLVYGVVRVSYDAYYTRLGVFPEAVGLTEATILGRAVLYLALTASVAAIVGGLWFGAVRLGFARFAALPPLGLAAAIIVPAALAAALVAAPQEVRELLDDRRFAYYCFQRCKFQPLPETTLTQLNATAADNASEHPDWDVDDFGSAWFVALPLLFLCIAALLPLLGRGHAGSVRRTAIGVFAALAAASLTAALMAPHLKATLLDAAATDAAAPLLAHVELVWWAVFVLLLLSIGGGLLAAGSRLCWRGSSGPIASFVVVLPLLLAFFAPNIPRFIQEEGLWAVLAALALWAVLLVGSFMVWPKLVMRELKMSPSVALFVALVVSLTLFLAWERGLNLAKQAAMGDQIYPQRFSMLSVRANVVCLEKTGTQPPVLMRRDPYTYLGQADGTLILYDYRADLRNDTPTSFPVRLPAGDAVVRLARYEPEGWGCGPN